MEVGVILLLFGLVLLSGSALAAFFWAVGDGQLEDLETAPEVIFDASEPMGEPGDCFPDARSRQEREKARETSQR